MGGGGGGGGVCGVGLGLMRFEMNVTFSTRKPFGVLALSPSPQWIRADCEHTHRHTPGDDDDDDGDDDEGDEDSSMTPPRSSVVKHHGARTFLNFAFNICHLSPSFCLSAIHALCDLCLISYY